MGNTVVEDVIAAADSVAKGLPTRLLQSRPFEEFSDDEVPSCANCGALCEWVYFSSAALKKLQGKPVKWCGACVDATSEDGAKQWKAHARRGLHQHLSAVKKLKLQVSSQNPQPGSSTAGQVKSAPDSENLQAGGHPMNMASSAPPPAGPRPIGTVVSQSGGPELSAQQQLLGAIKPTAAKPPLTQNMSAARAKLHDNMKTVLSLYFVRGQGEEFTSSGAEIVGQYRKHFRCRSPQWKQVYEVLTRLGFQCRSETVPSREGASKQLTRVVCGLKQIKGGSLPEA